MNLVAARWWSMLFMPSTLLMAGTALGLLLALRAWKRGRKPSDARLGAWLAAVSLTGLYLASTPLAARWAAWTLERENPPVDPAKMETADAIVVPGGSIQACTGPDGTVHVFARQSSDRFETAMGAFRAGRAPILAFGGGSSGVPDVPTEGQWNRGRAIELGIPADRVFAGPSALYTSDEGDGIAAILRERGVRKIILCTSATHLPRAAMHYRRLGFDVLPLPADFATRGQAEEFSLKLLVPRSLALSQLDSCAKEYLGLLAGRLGG